MLNPVHNVIRVEGLGAHVFRIDSGRFQLINHLLRVLLLPSEGGLDAGGIAGFQFQCVFYSVRFVQLDAFFQRH